ncbi:response regulator [Roseicyclus mahoneyensis]|uniref:histidine kinase n=1 Tax=Roseicyclus mahoneyensis TaxID=164332 RepID=A0A316G5W8_9RHOB|nr:response regulator [Roseicyclus mahoneyensis]PWK56294.1 histidine kinase/DNA gyrase B/HSP90-like ATPase [Roseicyclus mahoneyensis]
MSTDDTGGRAPADGPRKGLPDQTLQLFSHDIRSAMSDVIGGLRLVDRSRLSPEAQIQIDRVQAAADTLAALVDGALMAAAGETLIQQDATSVALSDWLAAINGRWSGRAFAASGCFALHRHDPLPRLLRVSQVTLDRIVGNLISNALGHAEGGAVTLRLAAAQGQGLVLTVADGGPGYPPDVLDRIDLVAGPAPMDSRTGSGLGLRIVADLTRAIGGSLHLSNPSTGGAQAVLHLPEGLLDWAPAPSVPDAAPDLSGLRVLVAEDNLTNQTILRQILGGMSADAVFVADGVAALEVLDRQGFDIALIDIEMPRLSGLEVMQAVRARSDAVAFLPMVALTAYVLRDNREAIYAAGADGIIGKPISSAAEFGRAVLRYAGRPAGLPEPEDVLAGDASLGRKMDQARFEALLEVAGPDGAVELLERLHEDLSTVRAALDVAVARGDIPEIRAQTHILIALSGAVGAERLYRLVEVLNIAAKRRRSGDLAALYKPCRVELDDLLRHVEHYAAGIGLSLPPA